MMVRYRAITLQPDDQRGSSVGTGLSGRCIAAMQAPRFFQLHRGEAIAGKPAPTLDRTVF